MILLFYDSISEAVSRRFVLEELKKRGQSTDSSQFFQFLREFFHLEEEEDVTKEPLKSLKTEAVVVTSKLRKLVGTKASQKRTSYQNAVKKTSLYIHKNWLFQKKKGEKVVHSGFFLCIAQFFSVYIFSMKCRLRMPSFIIIG